MLDVQALGPVRVLRDGQEIALRGNLRHALLGRLVCAEGRSVSREQLIGDLWGESAGTSAKNGVQVLVSGLRAAIGADVIATSGSGYRLGDAVRTDLGSFLRQVREADDALLRSADVVAIAGYSAALQLWRGEALQGVEAPFVAVERASLDEHRLLAFERRAVARLREGAFASAADDLAPLVREHPLREQLVAAHVQALAGIGRRGEALQLFEATRRQLLEEYGVGPGEQLSDAHRQVLMDESHLASRRPTGVRLGLGRLPAPMIGRDARLRDVLALIARPDLRLLTLVGTAGVGKTRLAEAVVEASPDRSAFASLLGAHDRTDVAPVIAHELGIAISGDGPFESIVAALRSEDALRVLVLDNLEHLPEAAAVVERMLLRVPSLTVVATSRRPLHLAGEHRYPVEPFAWRSGTATSAARIFIHAVQRVDPRFEIDASDLPHLEEILRRCEGLPLAIELAAYWASVLPLADLRRRLSRPLEALVDPRESGGARGSSLRSAIEWSVDQLGPGACTSLRATAVFPDRFTAHGLAAVAGIDVAAAGRHLTELVDCSLVARASSDRACFATLQVTRETVLDSVPPGEQVALRRAHLRWVHAPIAAVPRSRAYPSSYDELAALAAQQADVRAAIRFAAVHDVQSLVDLLVSLSTGWLLLGYEEELAAWCTTALDRRDLTTLQRFDCLLALERAVGLTGGRRSEQLLGEAGELVEDVTRDRRHALDSRLAYAALFAGDEVEAHRRAEALRADLTPSDEPELALLTDQLEAIFTLEHGDVEVALSLQRNVVSRATAAGLDIHAYTFAANLTEALLRAGRDREAQEVSLSVIAGAPSDAIFVRASATFAAGIAQFFLGQHARSGASLLQALDLMRGSTFDAHRLIAALALATGRLVPLPPYDQAALLATWRIGSTQRGAVPGPVEERLLASIPSIDALQALETPEVQEAAARGLSSLIDNLIPRFKALVTQQPGTPNRRPLSAA